jgi:hypothetical protein
MKIKRLNNFLYFVVALLFATALFSLTYTVFAHTISPTSENRCPDEHILLGGQCYDKSSEELFERIKRASAIQDATPSGQCPQDFHYISGKCYKAGTEQYNAVLKQASAAARAREAAAKTFESSVLSPLPQGSISQRVRGYELAIDIPCQPGIAGGQCPTITGPASYIARIYQFGLMIVGLLAFASIVYGALKYILSAGSLASLDEAKDQIKQAIFGVILLLGAFIVLYTINPQLVSLREPDITPVNIDEIIRRGEIAQEQSLGTTGPRGAGGDPLCSAGTYTTLKIGLNLSTTSSDLGAKIGEFSCTRCVDGASKQPDGKCQCQTGFIYSNEQGLCVQQ